jgi:hypothetical protein
MGSYRLIGSILLVCILGGMRPRLKDSIGRIGDISKASNELPIVDQSTVGSQKVEAKSEPLFKVESKRAKPVSTGSASLRFRKVGYKMHYRATKLR